MSGKQIQLKDYKLDDEGSSDVAAFNFARQGLKATGAFEPKNWVLGILSAIRK